MRQSRTGTIVMAAALAVAATCLAGELPDKSDAVPNYVRIGSGVAGGGQPALEAIPRLKELGFRTVVNLRTEGEDGYLPGEAAALEGAGIRYVHVPLTAATLSAADVAAVRAVLDDPTAAPVLIHCTTGNRVGGMWAAVLASRGKALEEAEAEGRRAGMHSDAMTAAVRRLAQQPPK